MTDGREGRRTNLPLGIQGNFQRGKWAFIGTRQRGKDTTDRKRNGGKAGTLTVYNVSSCPLTSWE